MAGRAKKNSTIEGVVLLADCGVASTSGFIGLSHQDEVKYIRKPLRSAARQITRPMSWVIVADGSCDDSMAPKSA